MANAIGAVVGCTAATAARILKGEPFSPSNNDYDWLGHGVYFWEHGPDRALRFIKQNLRREKRREKPFVVGAISKIERESHTQIAVRDPACIIGVFQPTPEELVQGLVRAGIVTKSGRFTAPYRKFESLPKVKRPKAAAR